VAPRKMCTSCGKSQKARGNAKWCHECWLASQPLEVRLQYAARRLAAVPEPVRMRTVPESLWPPGRRWCGGCQTFVRLRDCGKNATRCSTCRAGVAREGSLERNYSISKKEYDRLFRLQGGRCWFCGRRSLRVPLAADHNHRTGELRGLLCPDVEWGCNVKIAARIDADPDPIAMILRILDYYRNPPSRRVLEG